MYEEITCYTSMREAFAFKPGNSHRFVGSPGARRSGW